MKRPPWLVVRWTRYFLVNRLSSIFSCSKYKCCVTIELKNKSATFREKILLNPLQVELRCSLAKSYLSRDESSDEAEQGLVVSGLFIEGASLDLDQECLVEPT